MGNIDPHLVPLDGLVFSNPAVPGSSSAKEDALSGAPVVYEGCGRHTRKYRRFWADITTESACLDQVRYPSRPHPQKPTLAVQCWS